MNSNKDTKTDTIVDKIVQLNNNILSNNYFRTLMIILTGVFIGYTLNPIPKWLNTIFDTSYIFRFLILFYTGVLALYPLTKDNIKWITTGSIVCMYLFKLFRSYE